MPYTFATATTAAADFHVYAVDWYQDHLVFHIDGNTVVATTFDNGSPFAHKSESITLDVALGGAMGGNIKDGDLPTTMTVDYVCVYSLQ